jgi:DNA-binding NarL/FixJ family response regulator
MHVSHLSSLSSDGSELQVPIRRERQGADGADKQVLLVDDSPIIAERVCEAIAQIEHLRVADTADREPTAIDVLKNGGIDIVILDLHLDWGTGFGVLRHLLTIEHRRPRVIVFTSYDLPEYRRQAMALGADHFLDKARDFDRLLELLHAYAESEAGPAPTVQ